MLLANLILRVAVQFSKILGQQLVGVIRVARATVMIQVARATVMIQAARATVARAVVPRAVVPLAQAVPQATLQAARQFHVWTPLTKLIVAPPLVALGTAGFAQTKIRAVVARTVVQLHVRTPLTKLIVAPPLTALGTAGFAVTLRAVVPLLARVHAMATLNNRRARPPSAFGKIR